MHILGIETSCDETSAAVSNKRNVLSNVTVNQLIHNEYGGVVPEIASREHLSLISKVVDQAIIDAKISTDKIDAIAVTNGPGLKGALIVGVNFAKGLSIGLNVPIIPINHMEGHLFSNFIDLDKIKYPFLCMLVSGGHTQIWLIESYQNYKLYSTTIDDAAGEAFDKGARMLGLGYPGGPEIERIALDGQKDKYSFPIAKIKNDKNNFSFSGVKTSLFYLLKKIDSNTFKNDKNHIAASYQESILEALIEKLIFIANKVNVHDIVISGGVIANKRFREKLNKINKNDLYRIKFPNIKYCTDNAAMICMAGYEKALNNQFSSITFDAKPNQLMNDNES